MEFEEISLSTGFLDQKKQQSEAELENELNGWLKEVGPLDSKAMKISQKRWDSIAKPLHSLGKMEDLVVQIAGINQSPEVHLEKKGLLIMCADNGVVEEGVTQTGQEVTAIVSENFDEKNPNMTSAKLMAAHTKTRVLPVDIGVARDTSILNCKIAYGTKNMTKQPAMTRKEALLALHTGIELVGQLKKLGFEILCTGEMGIGNTTTSSAMASLLLGVPVETVTGKGAGLTSEGLLRKMDAIRRAIDLNRPDPSDAIDVLSKVGGLDIAGLAGVFLGGAIHRIPIVIDGFISSVAALTASRIYEEFECGGHRQGTNLMDYAIASHVSKEPAGHMLLEALGKEQMITCDMCLGEGTGAVAAMPLLDLAVDIYSKMSTFSEIHVEKYEPLN